MTPQEMLDEMNRIQKEIFLSGMNDKKRNRFRELAADLTFTSLAEISGPVLSSGLKLTRF